MLSCEIELMNLAKYTALGLLLLLTSVTLKGQGTSLSFEDVSQEASISSNIREPLLAFGDYDNDGDPDLLVDGHILYRNDCVDGDVKFTNVTTAAGLKGARGPSGCWFDFDLDGQLDFATSSGQVWINDGKGKFLDFSKELKIVFPHGSTSAMAWADIDGDGWIDVFGGGNNKYNPTQHFEQSLWLNTKRKKALSSQIKPKKRQKIVPMGNMSQTYGVDKKMYGRAVIAADFDWDGDQDIYSGNYHLKPNFLWLNEDGKSLRDEAASYGVTGRKDPEMFTVKEIGKKVGYQWGHTIGASWADLNNDGYLDLWVANLVHKYAGPAGPNFKKATGRSFDVRGYLCDDSNMFINQGPPFFHFVDERAKLGIKTRPIGPQGVYTGDELWSNAVCGDLDNNGWIDTFCNQIYGDAPYSYGVLYMNNGKTFAEKHKEAGIQIWGGYGGALADIDSDGRLDVVVCGAAKVDGKPAIHVFRNTTDSGPWVGFDLIETKGKQMIGAQVLLIQEGGVQLRTLATTMGSHGQQNDNRIHFGLGDQGAIVSAFVYWPDGGVQALKNIKAGSYHPVKPKKGKAPKVKMKGPQRVKVGEPATFSTTFKRKGFVFDWDVGGSRKPEYSTELPQIEHTFTAPGVYTVWLRVYKFGKIGREVRLPVEVVE